MYRSVTVGRIVSKMCADESRYSVGSRYVVTEVWLFLPRRASRRTVSIWNLSGIRLRIKNTPGWLDLNLSFARIPNKSYKGPAKCLSKRQTIPNFYHLHGMCDSGRMGNTFTSSPRHNCSCDGYYVKRSRKIDSSTDRSSSWEIRLHPRVLRAWYVAEGLLSSVIVKHTLPRIDGARFLTWSRR